MPIKSEQEGCACFERGPCHLRLIAEGARGAACGGDTPWRPRMSNYEPRKPFGSLKSTCSARQFDTAGGIPKLVLSGGPCWERVPPRSLLALTAPPGPFPGITGWSPPRGRPQGIASRGHGAFTEPQVLISGRTGVPLCCGSCQPSLRRASGLRHRYRAAGSPGRERNRFGRRLCIRGHGC